MTYIVGASYVIGGIIAIVAAWYVLKFIFRAIRVLLWLPGYFVRTVFFTLRHPRCEDSGVPVRLVQPGSHYAGEPKEARLIRADYNNFILSNAKHYLWKTWDELRAEFGATRLLDSRVESVITSAANYARASASKRHKAREKTKGRRRKYTFWAILAIVWRYANKPQPTRRYR